MELIPGPFVLIHEHLGFLVMSRGAPLDDVTGQGEWSTREADQGDLGGSAARIDRTAWRT